MPRSWAHLVAMMALKRKKQYENESAKIQGSRMTLETQAMAIENANVNLEAMQAMKTGADAMKTIHGKMYGLLSYMPFHVSSS